MTTRIKTVLLSFVSLIGIVIISISIFRDKNLGGFRLFMRILSLILLLGYGLSAVIRLKNIKRS